MELPGEDPQLAAHPKMTFQQRGFTYTVETHEGRSTYSVTDGVNTITLPIQWNFGEGAQTWVLVRNGHFYESLVSYYPSIQALDITTGDEQLKPQTLDEAVGRELSPMDVKSCFGCHTTDAVVDRKLSLETLKPGIGCSHCHEGSQSHSVAESMFGDGGIASAPPDLSRLNSEDISNFCGQCHRSWETVVRSGWHGVMNVRFQPYRLANSRCFDGTDPRISCLACHDPHHTVSRDQDSYDPKCIACHGTSATGVPASAPTGAKFCPVAKSNCAGCHMQSVPLIRGRMMFHDHQIRIVKAGEAYPD
ncbi:MAG TPA: hypothetical protein VMF66_05470 [Candidatus Acidoferrum sp.]|nr:hypothetical protein [Candidatus Acidoferrum sp.]